MSIASKIDQLMTASSWIRRMFEEGARLKQELGPDQVFDFSLGNPVLEPPEEVKQALLKYVAEAAPGRHRYMPNAGYPWVRAAIAEYQAELRGDKITADHVLMTTGAAGAMNCALRAILDPGDEVIALAPYFVEYRFYCDNHGGKLVVAETDEAFDISLPAIEAALTPQTRALILNSPNNPTGRVYTEEKLMELGGLLSQASRRTGRPIYLLSDEPYAKIIFDGLTLPNIFKAYPDSLVGTSHSKDLGLPGERIGYAVINPRCSSATKLFNAMTFTNRILGFVNAPAIQQHLVANLQRSRIDPLIYQDKRDRLFAGLKQAGYEVSKPQGAFYLFPRCPIADDVLFTTLLKEQRILAVPGTGFGRPGYLRLCYCVEDQVIEGSLAGFAAARQASLAKHEV